MLTLHPAASDAAIDATATDTATDNGIAGPMAAVTSPRLPRRAFLQAGASFGGGLVLGFALPARAADPPKDRNEKPAEAAVGQAAAKASPEAEGLAHNAFIRIDRQGQVTFVMHKVEMGQGTFTSMPMLLAEELEVDPASVRLEQAPPDGTRYADPLLGGQVTGGSTSVRAAYVPLRQAGAMARTLLIAAAADAWKVDAASCSASKGVVIHAASGRKLGYGALVDKASTLPMPKDVKLKEPKDFKLIGTAVKRLDSADKVNGRAQFGIDIRRPGMLVATVAASPVVGGTVASIDEAKAKAVKGVRHVVRIDNAVAVVADHMWAAKQGLAALDVQWTAGANAGFTTAALLQQMQAAAAKTGAVARNDGNAPKLINASAAAGGAAAGKDSHRRVDAQYQLPFLAHATMEPINCTVLLTADACELWVGTQVPTFAQSAAAKITGLPEAKVQVHNQYIGGGFGRRLEVDSVVQAVAFAKQLGSQLQAAGVKPMPVKFVWTREEDVQHDMYRPVYVDHLSAALDAGGKPVAWSHRVVGSSIMARFFPAAVKDGVDPDAVEGAKDLQYTIPNVYVDYVRHEPPVPTAFWRGVGPTHNIFVVESFVDELAAAAKQDPYVYRHALLDKAPRAKAVLELAAGKAGWGKPLAPVEGSRVGRGISVQFAFGSYMAQVAEVAVDADGEIKVTRVVCAVDCGQVINPDTVAAQIQSGVIFGLTGALWSEITFDQGRVQQSNFSDYRMMRINEAPKIEVYIVPSHDAPGGIGEPGTSAMAPALANAVFAATGKRLRTLPLKAEGLRSV